MRPKPDLFDTIPIPPPAPLVLMGMERVDEPCLKTCLDTGLKPQIQNAFRLSHRSPVTLGEAVRGAQRRHLRYRRGVADSNSGLRRASWAPSSFIFVWSEFVWGGRLRTAVRATSLTCGRTMTRSLRGCRQNSFGHMCRHACRHMHRHVHSTGCM